MERDWSVLPPELLQAIAEKIIAVCDNIRFRAVCHSWRSASSPRHLHLPWLMLPYEIKGNDDFTRLFYDLSASKIHRLDLPETQGAMVCGSSHGWLILCKDHVMSLLNPITRATIPLPPITVPPRNLGIAPRDWQDDKPFFEKWDADKYAMHPDGNFYRFVKAILTSNPLDPSCLVFFSALCFWQLAFCRIGDECWTVVEFISTVELGMDLGTELDFDDQIEDFTYSNGCLYAINTSGIVAVYDLNNRSRAILNCGIYQGAVTYLVDGVHGDILFFCQWSTYVDGELVREINTAVYKLNYDREPELIEVRNIGQNVLFVDYYGHAISFSTANVQLAEWGSNCLFYNWISTDQNLARSRNNKIKLVRLDDGTATDITGDLCSLQYNYGFQRSLWLTPSLF